MTKKTKKKGGHKAPDAKADPTPCACTVQHHTGTTIQRIAFYRRNQCSRKGVVTIQHIDGPTLSVCKQHARLAARGFLFPSGEVMSKASRSDYQTFRTLDLPPDFGKWFGTGYDHEASNFRIDNEVARREAGRRGRC